MPWNVAEPGDAGGFEGNRGIEAASNRAVDNGLLPLVEQCDNLSLRPNRPLQPPVRPIQKMQSSSRQTDEAPRGKAGPSLLDAAPYAAPDCLFGTPVAGLWRKNLILLGLPRRDFNPRPPAYSKRMLYR